MRRGVAGVTARADLRAWSLAEGDVLAGGARIVSVQRDPAADRVRVATDHGWRWTLRRQDPVVVAVRGVVDTGARRGGWAARLLRWDPTRPAKERRRPTVPARKRRRPVAGG